ncbi:alcohol dehydrogenase [Cupriavidus sp. USMAA2-4]|uniref:Alcohol dehydrogenase n=1 Tax=Cupriavidus malaysiensis TaxID=367825 RepID=A0ABM6F4G0_9BURK|nr:MULTISPECIES: DUF2970 domain-containing protein [Cupriavidus]AOY90682.1 alcohol dehydrogenase [Cupriavidus sp. USMAA2-4]AOY99693.1 alcohol dehydrogenase [Cupriavidus sp. USMAHM13]AOZ06316.1 alcohol dehydrogenase [Cupriavidus malaysiensis]
MHPLRLVSAVLWGFLGLRRGSEHQRDLQSLKPVHLLATGIALAGVLVLCLLMLARWAVAHA